MALLALQLADSTGFMVALKALSNNLHFKRHSGSDEWLRRTAAGQSGWLVCLLGKLHVTIPHISPGAKQRRVTGKT